MQVALQVLIAPLLVAAATLAARRWDQRIGGLVSAFPAIAGPVLLIDAQEHGTAFAARAATGTVLGLVALSGFALAYGRTARTRSWKASLLAGWATAAVLAAAAGALDAGLAVAVMAAATSLAIAYLGLGAGSGGGDPVLVVRWDLPLRMLLTLGLVAGLAALAGVVGPLVGGILTALPVLASVLAVFTHRRDGAVAAADLLRGMVAGMGGFAVFCTLVALLVDRVGVPVAFTVAALAGLATQAAAAVRGPGPSIRCPGAGPLVQPGSRRGARAAR